MKKAQKIIIIEAMKTITHDPSTNDGVFKKILVTDGEAVEFDQDLILVE
ncbi:MAG: biotin/lipoyl-containing protein [Candidatus Fonsibacter sp.]